MECGELERVLGSWVDGGEFFLEIDRLSYERLGGVGELGGWWRVFLEIDRLSYERLGGVGELSGMRKTGAELG